MAQPPISIIDAVHADLRDLVALRCEAAEESILTRFLYGSRHVEAVQSEAESLMASLGKRFTHPTNRCHIVKAVDTETHELVGWALVRWEDGSWVFGEAKAPVPSVVTGGGGRVSDPALFRSTYADAVRAKWRKLLDGKPHVVIGALNVRVDLQRRGIGKLIVDHLYRRYDLEKELVIVQTTASAEHFYAKSGWVTVDSTDTDLSQWAGPGMGYGVHRSPQMVRHPSSATE